MKSHTPDNLEDCYKPDPRFKKPVRGAMAKPHTPPPGAPTPDPRHNTQKQAEAGDTGDQGAKKTPAPATPPAKKTKAEKRAAAKAAQGKDGA